MVENIEHATPAQLEELIGHLVERVETTAKRVIKIVWTPTRAALLRRGGGHCR